jgi:hypothetical protein
MLHAPFLSSVDRKTGFRPPERSHRTQWARHRHPRVPNWPHRQWQRVGAHAGVALRAAKDLAHAIPTKNIVRRQSGQAARCGERKP